MPRFLHSTVAAIALTALHTACATSPPDAARAQPVHADGRQCTSLLDRPLFSPDLPTERRGQLEANLEIARRQHQANPSDESAAIWHGRRLGYLGRFRESIDVYSRAIEANPTSYRLLRHRGHRHITLRQFDLAVADLSRAWDLAKDQPDAPEPDGEPRAPGAAPTGTDKSNILYHLALAHYLRGEFVTAAKTFAKRTEIVAAEGGGGSLSDDTRIAFLNWHYLSLARAGDKDSAAKMLRDEYRPDMKIEENRSYLALVRIYLGEVPADPFAASVDTTQPSNLATAYGVAAFKGICGDRADSEQLLARIAASPSWPSFGVIAAEADLARARTSTAAVETAVP